MSKARSAPERGPVLLITDDAAATEVTHQLRRENVEVRWFADLETLDRTRVGAGGREPTVVVFDLERCRGTDDDIAVTLRHRFSVARLVAIASELDAARAARLLGHGVPSLRKPVGSGVLSNLALRLSETSREEPRTEPSSRAEGTGRLDGFLAAYSSERGLSGQQKLILRLHLAGNNDKEIASACSCSEATVYEHWRRMARKAGGTHKSSVITDFHRFLG